MRTRLVLIAPIALLTLSLAAHATDITYTITSGTFSTSGSFSGSFMINPTGEIIDSAQLTAIAPSGGTTYTFNPPVTGNTIGGLADLSDGLGDTFRLALNGPLSNLQLNTLAGNGASGDTALILATGLQFNATGGVVAPAVPEPSSLLLLSTGLLGFAGAVRRRLLA